MEEINKRLCKVCRTLKLRIEDGSFNYKDKRWRDESGLLWNGSTCPTCHKDKVANQARKRRQS
jgi:hypothetical protein